MGISSDLLVAVQPNLISNPYVINDLDEEISLYEIFDKRHHNLIYTDNSEIIDLEKIQEQFCLSEVPSVTSVLYNDSVLSVELNNTITLLGRDIPFCNVTFNCMDFEIIQYLGSSSCYKKEIFDLYNSKKSFKSLITTKEFLDFYIFENSFISLEHFKNLIHNKDSLFLIDLGY